MAITTRTAKHLTMLSKRSPKPVLRQSVVSTEPYLAPGDYAFDLETEGLDWQDRDRGVQLLAVANADVSIVFDYGRMDFTARRTLLQQLTQCRLTAWNLKFDAAWLRRECQTYNVTEPTYLGDAMLLYKLMTTESPNFSWALGSAQELVLGWDDSQKAWLLDALRTHKLTKDQMWHLYTTELAQYTQYCGADAQGCWWLWDHMQTTIATTPHLTPLLGWFDAHMQLLWLLLEQETRGIRLDVPRLDRYKADLDARVVQAEYTFRLHPDVQAYIKQLRADYIATLTAAEPAMLTKTGRVAKRWETWDAKLRSASTLDLLNINSGPQLKDLFFTRLGFVPTRHTDAGVPQLDRNLLPNLGEPGRLLADYRKLVKEQQYIESAQGKLHNDTIHPQFKIHATVTGRLGGAGGLNLQQQPKTRGYLECWRARPGYSLVQLDYTAVEPMILTEASGDPSLRKLYAPGMPANDIYLFVGAHIPAFSAKIRRWYDPDAPTADGIKLAKKHCKRERSICKTVHLAKQYGAGAHKIWSTLREAGEDVTLDEIMVVSRAWNELFAGIRGFGQRLQAEWEHNRGWVLNGMGRPMAVAEDLLKDITNRYCQSTGHDVLVWHLALIAARRDKLRMYPWIVDFHDEMIWEVANADVPAVSKLILDTLAALNVALPWEIKIKGEVQVAQSLADIKLEG